ncbi:oxidoreductase, FAD-binding protein [Proteus penneri ATCC 35198]|nr:oxidoreductase, FAD-binding protein [Proteus penneri ATCC 35198]
MANWVNGKVIQVHHWTDALISLVVNAPIDKFTAGQFAKLALDIDGERVQRAYSYVNAPDDPNLEFYLVTVPNGKLSPKLSALNVGDELLITKQASGFFCIRRNSHNKYTLDAFDRNRHWAFFIYFAIRSRS